MKILSAAWIKEADSYTILNEPIASNDLMERASRTFCRHFIELFPEKNTKLFVFCGSGNNGGDGLAISRMLMEYGYDTEVLVVASYDRSADCEANLEKVEALAPARLTFIEDGTRFPSLAHDSVIIDTLFGTGLSRPAEGLYASLINHINLSPATVVSVDVPSGLFTDKPNGSNDAIIEADFTFTFQFPKLSFLLCSNHAFTGNWEILDIGLSREFISNVRTDYFYLQKEDIRPLLKPRNKCDHKGTFGHALIWAGSYGKIGAAQLCAKACLHTGAGLTTAYIPGCGYTEFQTALPEIMVITDENKRFLTGSPDTFKYISIGTGPGIGTAAGTKDGLQGLLKHFKRPIVLDADALNIIAQHPEMLERIPANSILTPHPKEFSRLAGESKNDWERLEKAIGFAATHNIILILKSAYTSVHLPDGKVFFNSTGNPGMAKGGSGDVLTGMLTALLCQGYSPEDAAITGVYLHGLAGDIAAEKYSQWSMTASDLIENIGAAFMNVIHD